MESGIAYISLSDALRLMNRRDVQCEPIPFDCTYRTFNERTRTGGVLKSYDKVKCLPLSRGDGKKYRRETIESLQHIPKKAINPNHYENKTRTLKLATGAMRKVNINFLISIEGKLVHF